MATSVSVEQIKLTLLNSLTVS